MKYEDLPQDAKTNMETWSGARSWEDRAEYYAAGYTYGRSFDKPTPADKVVVDREERIQELQLLLNVLQHDEPQKGHDGGCHPDAGCDGDCANYYYHWQEVRKAEAKLDVLRAQAKEGGEG